MSSGPAFKDHFSDIADDYAKLRPTYPPALVEFLAAQAPARRLAWEAGCGSGQLSALLGERFDRVVATDASAEQLARARPHPRVEYRHARAEASGLPPVVADLVVAAQAAHWFDIGPFYAEVRRVARPGALLALTVYNLVRVNPRVDATLRRFYTDVLGRYWAPERRHVEADYATIPFPFAPVAAPPFELHATWTLAHFVGYVRTWSATVALEKEQGAAPIESLWRELEPAWGAGARECRWPLTVRAGRVS